MELLKNAMVCLLELGALAAEGVALGFGLFLGASAATILSKKKSKDQNSGE